MSDSARSLDREELPEDHRSEIAMPSMEDGNNEAVVHRNSVPKGLVTEDVSSALTVGLVFAISGQYEDYRERLCLGYESVHAAKAEADRRNALVIPARDKMREAWDLPSEQYDLSDKRQKRILAKLRREAADPEIESHDIGDLNYSVTEARIIRRSTSEETRKEEQDA